MEEKKFNLSWKALDELLTKQGTIAPFEEISEITLVKPRALQIRVRRVKSESNSAEAKAAETRLSKSAKEED